MTTTWEDVDLASEPKPVEVVCPVDGSKCPPGPCPVCGTEVK